MGAFWDNIAELNAIIEKDQSHNTFEKLVLSIYNAIDSAIQCDSQVRCRIFKSAGFLGFPPKQVTDPSPRSVSIVPFGSEAMEDSYSKTNGESVEFVTMTANELIDFASKNHIDVINIMPNKTVTPSHHGNVPSRPELAKIYLRTPQQIFVDYLWERWAVPCIAEDAVTDNNEQLQVDDTLIVAPEGGNSFEVKVYEIRGTIVLCEREAYDKYDNFLGVSDRYLFPKSAVINKHVSIKSDLY